jgi:hypothetical protein
LNETGEITEQSVLTPTFPVNALDMGLTVSWKELIVDAL